MKIFKIDKILILLILILAFVLRVYKLDKVPPGLYWDEAAMALDAKSISLTGKDQHGNNWLQPIYPSWGDYKLPGYILTAVPVFEIIRSNPELAIRFPSALAGTLTVLIIYLLTKELFKNFNPKSINQPHYSLLITNYLPIIASLLLAISPWHLQFSRAAFEGNLALFFNTTAIYFFIKSIKQKRWLCFTLIFSTFGIYTYYSSRIVLPLILFLIAIIYEKKTLKNALIYLLFSFLLFISFLPLQYSPLAAKAEQFRLSTKNILNNDDLIKYSSNLLEQDNSSFVAKKIHNRWLYKAKDLASHYFDHFSLNYLILSGDINLRHSTAKIGVLLFIGFIGLLYGEYLLFLQNKKLFIVLNSAIAISLLPAGMTYEVPHSLRSLNAAIFYNIISAFGLIHLLKINREKKLLFSPPAVAFPIGSGWRAGVFCFLFLAQLTYYLHDYYVHYPIRSYFAWQGGYKDIMLLINKEYPKTNQIIVSDVYARPYIYFLLYTDYSIRDFQSLRIKFLEDHSLNYIETMNIGKIEFRRPVLTDFDNQKTLIIAKPSEMFENTGIKVNRAFNLWKNF